MVLPDAAAAAAAIAAAANFFGAKESSYHQEQRNQKLIENALVLVHITVQYNAPPLNPWNLPASDLFPHIISSFMRHVSTFDASGGYNHFLRGQREEKLRKANLRISDTITLPPSNVLVARVSTHTYTSTHDNLPLS